MAVQTAVANKLNILIMKKILYTLVAAVLCSFQSFAQDAAINRFFSEYENRDNVTLISLSGKAFEIASQIDVQSDETEDFKRIAGQITGFRMLIDNNDTDAKSTAKRARREISSKFEDLITIREKDSDVKIAINESNGLVTEIIAIIGSDTDFMLASISGRIKLSDVTEVTKRFSSMGKDVFAKSLDPSKILVFPSPALKGQEISVVLPSELNGATVQIFDVSGKIVADFIANDKMRKLNTDTFGTGVFILKATKGDLETTRKFLIN